MKTDIKYNKPNLRGLVKSLMLISAVALLFTSCTKDYNSGYYQQIPGNVAQLNVVQASPGTASFNFALDNNFVQGPPLLYGQHTGYINAYSGKRLFSLFSGGTSKSIGTDTLNLTVNNYYSLFVTGLNSAPAFLLTTDDLTAPPAGKAKIRFVQLSPDGGSFDLGITGGATLFANQAYKTASDFTSIDPAVYHFQLKADQTGTVTPIDSITIHTGKIYTVLCRGLAQGGEDYGITGKVTANN